MSNVVEPDTDYPLPLPRLRGLTAEWYTWLTRHELRFQRCDRCLRWRHVPREVCPGCGSTEWTWERSTGRGRIYSWTTVYRSLHPDFQDTPYAAVVVELEEGPRVMTRVIDRDPDGLEIGLPVVVEFDDVTAEVTLATFRTA